MPTLSPDTCNLIPLKVRHLGLVEYQETFDAMRDFTAKRDVHTPDEIWLLQHPPVFTQGRHGKPEHLLARGDTPLLQSDRGGQVTYHGPGQLIAYLLLDLGRRGLGVRHFVTLIEQAVIDLLDEYGITAHTRPQAPGVYVEHAKVAALGLRIKRGCSYHGLSLNVQMELTPFTLINPCGHPGMAVTDLHRLGVDVSLEQVSERLLTQLKMQLLNNHTH